MLPYILLKYIIFIISALFKSMLLLFHKGCHLKVTKQQVFTILAPRMWKTKSKKEMLCYKDLAHDYLLLKPVVPRMHFHERWGRSVFWLMLYSCDLITRVHHCGYFAQAVKSWRFWVLNSEWLQTDAGTVSLQQQKCYWKTQEPHKKPKHTQ